MFARFGAVSVFGCAAMYVDSDVVPASPVATGLVKPLIGAGAVVFGNAVAPVICALSNALVGTPAFGVATVRKARLCPATSAGPDAAANATKGLADRLPLVITAPLAL